MIVIVVIGIVLPSTTARRSSSPIIPPSDMMVMMWCRVLARSGGISPLLLLMILPAIRIRIRVGMSGRITPRWQ